MGLRSAWRPRPALLDVPRLLDNLHAAAPPASAPAIIALVLRVAHAAGGFHTHLGADHRRNNATSVPSLLDEPVDVLT